MKLKEIKKSNLIFMDEVPHNEVKKIIGKIEKKPITSYYKFSLIGNTENDVEKDDLGYMVEYDKVKFYKKNKVYAYDGYGKMNNSIINMNIAFKAEYPFNLIYASSTLKEEDKIITSNDLFYEKDELISNIYNKGASTKINQGKVIFSIGHFLAPDIWVNSNKRKIGDNKQFMQIDLETGNFVQENHEILNIENIECRTTTNLIRSFDYELGYEKDMIMIRNKKKLIEYIMPDDQISAKLVKKSEIFPKIIN